MQRSMLVGVGARAAWRITLVFVAYFVLVRLVLLFPQVQRHALTLGSLGALLGTLMFSPLLLVAAQLTRVRPTRMRFVEGGLTLFFLVLASGLGAEPDPFMPLVARAYLIFPPLLWAAIRFGVPGASLAAFFSSALAIWSAHAGFDSIFSGAQAISHGGRGVLALYTFLSVATIAALVLGALSTERREALAAVTREHAFVSAVLDTAGLLVVLDPHGRIVRGNRACEALLGRTDLQGRDFSEVFANADEHELVEDALDALCCERRATSWESHCATSAGSERVVAWSSAPLLTDGGEVEYMIVSGNDLTDRRSLEAKLVLADRLAAVGTLAAGVGHEINNPLAYSMLSLELARKHTSRLHEVAPSDALVLDELLRSAHEGNERVRRIVGDLKALARSDDDLKGPVDVREVIESCIPIAWNEIRHRARLVKDYGSVPDVLANDGRLGQVFLNLLVNAAQAIPEGRAEENVVRVSTRSDAHGRVIVEVSDTGAGIAAQVRAHLFEPFFTTKSVGAGVGLGLSVCHSIVTQFGGSIEVDSKVGAGALFRVILPAAKVTPIAIPIAAPLRAVGPLVPLRILIADDEPHLARSLAQLLAEHEVSIADSGRKALSMCSSSDYDLVFCDLLMPDLTGMDVYTEIQARRPECAERFVFMTGGAFTSRAREFLAKVPNAQLQKPFDSERLFALVAERSRKASTTARPERPSHVGAIEPRTRKRSGESVRVDALRHKFVG